MTLDAGAHLGHYEVVAHIGSGGMGDVYRAKDLKLGRDVALKLLRDDVRLDPSALRRFEQEARAASSLDHPNIVTIFEIAEDQRQTFIVMQYVQGRSLREVLQKGKLPLRDAVKYAVEIADGLAAAHERDIVHRDIKPDNIMVTEGGRIKILDFGLAKLLEPIEASESETKEHLRTREGHLVGTIPYMSPEQAQGRRADARSDVFSFGAVLYEMVAGSRPFAGASVAELLATIIRDEPRRVSDVVPSVPMELEQMIGRALRKDPERRFQSMADLRGALLDLKEGMDSGALTSADEIRRIREKSRGWQWTRARTLGVLAGCALGVLAGTAILLRSNLFAPPPPPPKHTQVTFLGDANFSVISPDGKFMAYTRGTLGDTVVTKVFVQEIGAGQAIEVFEGASIWDFSWSPDGSELLISRGEDRGQEKLLVPRLGGAARRFACAGEEVAWSPDGTRFAGHSFGRASITVTDKTTGESRSISFKGPFPHGRGANPLIGLDWSPAGGWLVFGDYDEDRFVLWTLNVNGSEPVRILDSADQVYSPRWSPEGDAVYYVRRSAYTSEIWKLSVSPRTGRAHGSPRLVMGGLNVGSLSLSGNGKRLLSSRFLIRRNLWLVRPQGSGGSRDLTTHQITTGTVHDSWQAVSPDGTRVAFTRFTGDTSHIFVVPMDGGTPQQITFSGSQEIGSAWSPDGKEIAFSAFADGIQHIATASADGGGQHVFAKSQPMRPMVAWAPGPRIVFLGENGKLQILDPVSGEEASFPREEWQGQIAEGLLSPEGKRVAVSVYEQKGSLRIVVASLETGASRVVSEKMGALIGWAADGKGIYFRDDTEEHSSVVLIPAEGGEPKLVARLPFAVSELGICAATPDGRAFVCDIAKDERDLWLIENFDPEIR